MWQGFGKVLANVSGNVLGGFGEASDKVLGRFSQIGWVWRNCDKTLARFWQGLFRFRTIGCACRQTFCGKVNGLPAGPADNWPALGSGLAKTLLKPCKNFGPKPY